VTRFLIVEDHPLFREALGSAVRGAAEDAEIFEAASIDEATAVLSSTPAIDLILLDLSMPGTTGPLGLIRIRKAFPKNPIVVVSVYEEPQIIASILAFGVSGYIPKSTPKSEISRSIVEVLRGGMCLPSAYRDAACDSQFKDQNRELLKRLHDLTPQQLRVLDMLGRGLQNKQIAHELDISETTVKVHVSDILRKLNVLSRTRAIIEIGKIDFTKFGGDHAAGTRVDKPV
jgi:DNA-binding NarL/FixJ family response regulator